VRAIITKLVEDDRALRSLQAPEQVVFDPLENRWAVSPSAFRPQSDGTISVDLEQLLKLDDKPLSHGYPRIARAVGLVAHRVGRLGEAGFTVAHVPIEGNDYHGEAKGKPSRSERDNLAKTCEIIVDLDGDTARRHEDERLAREAKRRISQG
jgi:hypothetical protein